MNFSKDIETRTFGVELEMCDFIREKVILPKGFEWDEEEVIDNTDGFKGKKYGGEINSSPLLFSEESFLMLDDVIKQMVNAGGRIAWFTDIHVHIYAKDLSVEQLKKLVAFEYYCYPFFKQYTKTQDWNELIFNSRPLITEKKYNAIREADSLESLRHALENNSNKGYIRYAINVASYFVHDTVEFRCYKMTDKIDELKNCVEGTYKMFYYAISHEEEDFQKIGSYEDFVDLLGLPQPIPEACIPLIYQGNPYSPTESYMTRPVAYNSSQASALYEAFQKHGLDEICIANGFLYYYELFFKDKIKVSVCCQNQYCHLLYLIANGKITLKYKEKLSWLEEYNRDDPLRQLALALYSMKLQKYLMSNSTRNDEIVFSLKLKSKESIERTEKSSKDLLEFLSKCEFFIASIQDAIALKKAVFFNFGIDKKQKRTFKLISENSDLDVDKMSEGHLYYEDRSNNYYDLIENMPDGHYFYYFSNSPYLSNMHKLAMWDSSSGERWSAGRFLYCNKPCNSNQASTSYKSSHIDVNEVVPPDDLVIDNPNSLKIARVDSDCLYALQKKYIRKVDMVSHCTYAFVVMYEKYTLGGFGFTLPQHKGYDLFQLTDFCTNNNVPRLAKLILLCIQTAGVQRELSRRMHKLCEKVISCAYTHKPVSMKYRGVYTKVKEHCTSSYLAYEGQLGKYATNKEVIEKYQKMLKNGN